MIDMHDALKDRIHHKVRETIQNGRDLRKLANVIYQDPPESFIVGMAMGRLYNSFYYQSRRIQKRDPTPDELDEFLSMVDTFKDDIVDACR